MHFTIPNSTSAAPSDHAHPARALPAGPSTEREPAAAATIARAPSPSASAGRSAAARRRCCSRCAAGCATRYNLAVVTNDIFTREDAEFLVRHQALAPERIAAVETGGCPHTAVRDDVSQNLDALEQLMASFQPELLFVESGGDNLAAQFSRELADYTIYVIDVSGGDKIPRKGGPGITQSDLLVINKTDLAPLVGADLGVMERDARGCAATARSCSRRSPTASAWTWWWSAVLHAWRHARAGAAD